MNRPHLLVCVLVASCGGGGTTGGLTPEQIGQKAFDLLKADNFTGYYTQLVATPTMVKATCPGLAPALVDRYFESQEGSVRLQEERFVECRANIDFSQATLSRVRVRQKTQELTPPECVQPILRVDVNVDVRVGGDTFYFTVGDVMQFTGGWRAYRRLKDCGNVEPP
jgi:hypothetical protein